MFDDSKEAIKYIVNQYGTEILYDSKRLCSLVMDLVCLNNKERNILKIAINAKIPVKLAKIKKDDDYKESIISQCKLTLYEDYGIEKNWANFAVDCFAYALGLDATDLIKPDIMLANIVRQMLNS